MATRAFLIGVALLLVCTVHGATAQTCGNGLIEAGEQCDDGDDNPANQCSNQCALKHADVLILGSTMVEDHEKLAAEAAGLTVDVITDDHLRALKTEDFARYRAFVIGDPRGVCPASVGETVAAWGPAMTGNVILVGGDPSDHGRVDATRAFIQYAAGGRTGTVGFYAAVDYQDSEPTSFLPWLNAAFASAGDGVFDAVGGADYDLVYQTLTGPGLEAFSEAMLTGWEYSVHIRWLSFPDSFGVLAMAADGPGTTSMVRVNHAADGPQSGSPYIVVRTTTGQLASGLCGDGTVSTGEECDDGNTVGGDGCASDCLFEVCGNGQVDIGEACDDGNTVDNDGCSACQVDPCGVSDNCSMYAQCENSDGMYTCTCLHGFSGTGDSCSDIDECTDGTHSCPQTQECVNTVGSFYCGCGPGMEDDGTGGCQDVDECSSSALNNCHADADCVNVEGGFECTCPPGTTGDGVSACDTLANCGEPGSDGLNCICPTAANSYSVAVAIDFVPDTKELVVDITGAFARGIKIQNITVGPDACYHAAPSQVTCLSDCTCSLRIPELEYKDKCQWLKQPLSLGETGVRVQARVEHTKTVRNIVGDEIVTPDVAVNVVEIITEKLSVGFGQIGDMHLIDMLVTQDRLIPAAGGNDVAVQELEIEVTSHLVELLPGSTFSNGDVTLTIMDEVTNCVGLLCTLRLKAHLATHADLCTFSGSLSIPVQPTCTDCGVISLLLDLKEAEYDFKFCRSQTAELASVANVNIEALNSVATATEPAVFRVTAEVLDTNGIPVPSVLLGAVAYHARDGEPCSAASRSTPIIDANGASTVPWVSVSPVDDPTAPLHTFDISVYATEESVSHILELEGGDYAAAALGDTYSFDNLCFGVHRIRELDGLSRRRLATEARRSTAASTAATTPRVAMASRSSRVAFSIAADALSPPNDPPPPPPEDDDSTSHVLVFVAASVGGLVALAVAGVVVMRLTRSSPRRGSVAGGASNTSADTVLHVAPGQRKPVRVEDTVISVM